MVVFRGCDCPHGQDGVFGCESYPYSWHASEHYGDAALLGPAGMVRQELQNYRIDRSFRVGGEGYKSLSLQQHQNSYQLLCQT